MGWGRACHFSVAVCGVATAAATRRMYSTRGWSNSQTAKHAKSMHACMMLPRLQERQQKCTSASRTKHTQLVNEVAISY